MVKQAEAGAPRKVAGIPLNVRTVAGAVLVALATWFILMNTASVKIHLWGISVVVLPLWAVLVVILAVGVVLGWFLRRYRTNRK
ncbi:DUF1049 domain-containing protein [Streptacidiphilus sp. EB129]|uniref:DUF1049 domain-containing protein n=1 Tax=Streptacidiphilus sp. EB129 TaxID=3156262 RepID=UPI0035133024